MKTTRYKCAACGEDFENTITVTCSCGVFEACPNCGCWDFEEDTKTLMCREELKQYTDLVREIRHIEERLERKGTQNRVELEEQYHNNLMRCMALRLKTESFIFGINDSFIRQIFEARYIRGLSWAAVAVAMGGYYSADYLRLKHDRYLKRVEKFLSLGYTI